jgi:hypothetical protein
MGEKFDRNHGLQAHKHINDNNNQSETKTKSETQDTENSELRTHVKHEFKLRLVCQQCATSTNEIIPISFVHQ